MVIRLNIKLIIKEIPNTKGKQPSCCQEMIAFQLTPLTLL